MTAPAASGSARGSASGGAGVGGGPILPMAVRRLAGESADSLRILGDYAAALRAIVDHPALDPGRKRERLAAVARALEGGGAGGAGDAGERTALTLRHLLEEHGIGIEAPSQMLQAAAQDIAKMTYPDWSDLLAWCRYWAAPMGRLGVRLAAGREDAEGKGEIFATAVQLLYLIEHAPLHYRWLGRVYLPERWFKEAGAGPGDLGASASTAALKEVFARAGGEAGRLLVQCRGLHRAFAYRRMRIAAATAHAEARAWAGALARGDPLTGPCRPGRGSCVRAAMAGLARGLVP